MLLFRYVVLHKLHYDSILFRTYQKGKRRKIVDCYAAREYSILATQMTGTAHDSTFIWFHLHFQVFFQAKFYLMRKCLIIFKLFVSVRLDSFSLVLHFLWWKWNFSYESGQRKESFLFQVKSWAVWNFLFKSMLMIRREICFDSFQSYMNCKILIIVTFALITGIAVAITVPIVLKTRNSKSNTDL